jgi:hypothetical protein
VEHFGFRETFGIFAGLALVGAAVFRKFFTEGDTRTNSGKRVTTLHGEFSTRESLGGDRRQRLRCKEVNRSDAASALAASGYVELFQATTCA